RGLGWILSSPGEMYRSEFQVGGWSAGEFLPADPDRKKPARRGQILWPRRFQHIYRLPKVISEMVGQTCRFAATTRRSSPTISEISFGNHSIPEGKTIQWSAWRRNANGEGAVGRARGGRAPRFHPAP